MVTQELVKLANQRQGFNYSQISSFVGAHQYLLLYKLAKKYLPVSSLVLDWGTGNGHFSYFLCRSGYKTAGFSMEDFYFKDLIKAFPYKFVKGNPNEPSRLPFNENAFDGVVSVGVLEHVEEYGGTTKKSLAEIARILKRNGVFICYHLPNYYSWIEFLGKLLTNNFHHQKRFTKKDIEKFTQNAGLEIIEIGRYGFLPRNSFSKLPRVLRFSQTLALFWDFLDHVFETTFSLVCQNYYFVARKID